MTVRHAAVAGIMTTAACAILVSIEDQQSPAFRIVLAAVPAIVLATLVVHAIDILRADP